MFIISVEMPIGTSPLVGASGPAAARRSFGQLGLLDSSSLRPLRRVRFIVLPLFYPAVCESILPRAAPSTSSTLKRCWCRLDLLGQHTAARPGIARSKMLCPYRSRRCRFPCRRYLSRRTSPHYVAEHSRTPRGGPPLGPKRQARHHVEQCRGSHDRPSGPAGEKRRLAL
jgi:hypothetical protein